MSQIFQFLCCCFYSEPHETQGRTQTSRGTHSGRNKQPKIKPQPKPSRIISKYKSQETVQMKKQQRKKGTLIYTCPICTLYLNKILSCTNCQNLTCRKCVDEYEKKFQLKKQNMKCPFCNSQTSNFVDYELEAKSYFDTTGKNGFLDPLERKKIDEQLKWNESKYLDNNENQGRLQMIQQQANQNGHGLQNHLEQIQHYNQVSIRRNQSHLEQQQNESMAQIRSGHLNPPSRQEFHLTV